MLVVLPQVLTVFHDYEQALLGLIVMVFMIFLRQGIVPSLAARSRVAQMMILEADRLSIAFGGVRAIDGVSVAIASGQVFSIIGPNGSGKTTLLNLVSGIYVPQDGSIKLAGEDGDRSCARPARATRIVADVSEFADFFSHVGA